MTKFYGKYTKDGFDFGEIKPKVIHHAKHNIGKRFILEDLEPESKKQRGFFEGAVIPMWVYLDGNDHRSSIRQKQYHELAKEEFNPEIIIYLGKQKKVAGSTKGKLNGENGMINKVIDFLEEQYAIKREEVLLPSKYKHWKDTIYPYKCADNYVDYLVETKQLKRY